MCHCVINFCTHLNRVFNGVLALLGFVVLSYGLFIFDLSHWKVSIFPVALMSWGLLLALLTSSYSICIYKNSCCLQVYAVSMFIFFLLNAVGVVFYFTHQAESIDYLNKTLVDVPDGLLDPTHLQSTVTITLYSIASLSGLILMSSCVALCQRSAVLTTRRMSSDNDYDDDNDSYRSLTSDPVVAPKRRSDLDRAVKKSEAAVAAHRFREKYSDMYDKYNIQSN